jgi:transcriptional regulator with GAF, ATPase, and Fis domain
LIGAGGPQGQENVAARPTPDPHRQLTDVYHRLLSEDHLDSVLEGIADMLRDLIPYDTLTIYRADEAQRVLVPTIARDRWAAEILRTRPAFGMGITGWAVEHREPVRSSPKR